MEASHTVNSGQNNSDHPEEKRAVRVPDFEPGEFCDREEHSGERHMIILDPENMDIVGWCYHGNQIRRDVHEGNAYHWPVPSGTHGGQLSEYLRSDEGQALLLAVVDAHNGKIESLEEHGRYSDEYEGACEVVRDADEALNSVISPTHGESDFGTVWTVGQWVDLYCNGGRHPAECLVDEDVKGAESLAEWVDEVVRDEQDGQDLLHGFTLADEIEEIVCDYLDSHELEDDERVEGVWRLAIAMGWRTEAQLQEARECVEQD